jgi:hypothetical protein
MGVFFQPVSPTAELAPPPLTARSFGRVGNRLAWRIASGIGEKVYTPLIDDLRHSLGLPSRSRRTTRQTVPPGGRSCMASAHVSLPGRGTGVAVSTSPATGGLPSPRIGGRRRCWSTSSTRDHPRYSSGLAAPPPLTDMNSPRRSPKRCAAPGFVASCSRGGRDCTAPVRTCSASTTCRTLGCSRRWP